MTVSVLMIKCSCRQRRGRKMTFTAYIERQKSLIRSRHETEIILATEEESRVADSDTLFEELSSIKGLNVAERLEFSKVFALA